MGKIVVNTIVSIMLISNYVTTITTTTEQTFLSCLTKQAQTTGQEIKDIEYVYCENISDFSGINQLQQVKTLEIVNSKVSVLPESISNLKMLDKIVLFNNKYDAIPQVIFNMPQLKELIINNNEVAILDAKIGTLTNLEKLSLAGNKLVTLPDTLQNLTKLKELNISVNRLQSLPNLEQLQNLEILNLENNQLKELSDLSNLALTHLNVEKNPLQVTTVQTKEQLFTVTEIYTLQTIYNNMTVKVTDQWQTYQRDLIKIINFSNGIKPYGYDAYQIVELSDQEGRVASLDTYLDLDTYQVKEQGIIYGKIALIMNNNIIHTTQQEVKFIFEQDGNNENDAPPTPPLENETPTIDSESDNTQETQHTPEANVTIYPALPTNSDNLTTINWAALMQSFGDTEQSLNTYQNSANFWLSMILAFIALLPIIIIIWIFIFLKKMQNQSDEIFMSEGESR